jgi:NADH-quinone oxidoreductase subunit M
LVIVVPLLAALVVLFDALGAIGPAPAAGVKKKKNEQRTRWSERAVVIGTGGALVAAAVTLLRVVTGAGFGYFQLVHGERIGMTDVSLTLSLDAMRAALAVAAAGGASWAALLLAKKTDARTHAGLLAMLTGAELVIASDGAFGIVAGAFALGAGALLAREAGAEGAVATARMSGASGALVLIGASILSWGIAGAWSDGDFTPELYPRFTLAKKTTPISDETRKSFTKGDGKKAAAVSMAAMGGAFLYLDDSRTPWEIEKHAVHPPFVEEPLAAGIHSFRIHSGVGLDDHVVAHVTIEDGQNATIVPVGSTLSPRELRDQLDVIPAPTEDLPMPTRDGFGTTQILGIGVATLGQWLFVLAAAALAFASMQWGRERPSPFVRARSLVMLACAAAIAHRVDFLGRCPTAAWLGVIAIAGALGFVASRAAQDPFERVASLVRAAAESVRSFDERVLDAPFRILSLSRAARGTATTIVAFVIGLASLLAATDARAADTAATSAPGQKVSVTANGTRGPLILTPKGADLVGQIDIENRGKEPLSVLRVAVRTDAHDVRAPVVLGVKTESPLPMTLAPGAHLKANVTLNRATHVDEVFAHIIVTTTDEHAGEVAIGVIGYLPQRAAEPLGKNGLSMLILVLVAAGVLAFVVRAMKVEWAGRFAAVGAAAGLAVLGLLLHRFEPALSRLDGNDGLSFIERSELFPSLGSELFFAADGLSLVVATALVFAAGVALLFSDRSGAKDDTPTFERALVLLAVAAGVGAVFARDLLLFVVLFGAACSLATLVVRAASPSGNLAFGKMRAVVFIALVLVALTVFALRGASDHAFLVDGTKVDHTFGIADLSRVAFAQKNATFLGGRLVTTAYVVLVLAFAALAGAPPFHTYTLDALSGAPRSTAGFAIGLVRALGLYGLVHVVLPVLPESSRWGAGGVAWLAVAGAVYASACAFAERRLGRRLGYLIAAQASLALLGFASVTPQGVVAVLFGIMSVLLSSVGASALGVFGVRADALVTETSELSTRARGAVALVALSCAAMPAFPGFYCAFSATLAATARTPLQVLFLVVAFALVVAAAAAFVPPLVSARSRATDTMQPAHNWALFALLLSMLLTGVFPATVLELVTSSIRDRISAADPPGAAEIAMNDQFMFFDDAGSSSPSPNTRVH